MNKMNYQKELDKLLAIPENRGKTLFLHSCCAPCSSYVLIYLSSFFRITVYYYNPNITDDAEYVHRVREQKRLIECLNNETIKDMPLWELQRVKEWDKECAECVGCTVSVEGTEEGTGDFSKVVLDSENVVKYEDTCIEGREDNVNTCIEGSGDKANTLLCESGLRFPINIVEGNHETECFYEASSGLEMEPEGGARCAKCFRLRLESTYKKAKEAEADFFGTTLTISPLKNAQLINDIGYGLSKISKEGAGGPKWLPSDFKKQEGYKHSIELSKRYDLYRQNFCGCEFSRN